MRAILSRLCLLLAATPAVAQTNEECLACHDAEWLEIQQDGRTRSLFVDPERYGASVHKALDCVACHSDLSGVDGYPHAKGLGRVDCTDCHDDDDGPVEAYRQSTHGLQAAQGHPLAPLCQDCHGGHYVAKRGHPGAATSPFNVPVMCGQCHTGHGIERVWDLTSEQARARFVDRIHSGSLFEKGLEVTATCASCHAGHAILPALDPGSRLHADNVNGACLACHGRVEEVHREVMAPDLWGAGYSRPICVDCHPPHEPRRVFYDSGLADQDCLSCHGRPGLGASADGRSLSVDADRHASSVHGRHRVSCAQCHSGVRPSAERRPCADITAAVRCDACHAGTVGDYASGIHGKLAAEGDANAPRCVDCHGTHGILEHALAEGMSGELRAAVRGSPTFQRDVPELCGRCHRAGAPAAARYTSSQEHVLRSYTMSIHGKGLLESGLTVTAVCADCHTAHRELPASDPESTVHADNVATTCGRCHDGIHEVFETSIHSPAGNPRYGRREGTPELPRCNDCHSSHEVERTDLPAFQLGIMKECGACHAAITETYFETYHGKASALGDTTRAKCHDCHGSHGIRPAGDPRSTLSEANIVATCGQCHPGSHPGFTTYLTHADHHDRERYPALFWAFWGMTSLLIGVFVFFGLHTLAWLPRSWKLYKQHRAELAAVPPQTKQFLRFSRLSRGLHLTVILTFFGLAITGMMLKFSHTGWAQLLVRMIGGIGAAGFIHRVCAVVTFGYMGVHIWDVARRFRRSGKRPLEFLFGPDSLLPTWKDVRDFGATLKWFAGRGPMPRYGRWTYWEKFDYLAVFWGVVIIGLSGLFLWFPVQVTHVLPGWAINVATIIHSDEALLAVGFIFTIHFFNTHLRPEKFPMDPVIFTGRMPVSELKLERPSHYEELQASGELERRLVDPAPARFVTLARAFGYTALLVGLTLVVLIIWAILQRWRASIV